MAKKATLLIVDRERMFVDLLTRALASSDLAVHGATTADEAVKLLDLHGADLVVIDPSIQNGIPLVSSLRSGPSKAKVVAIVAGDDLKQRVQAMGIEAVVDRGSGLDALVAAIKTHISADLSGFENTGIRVLVADDEDALRNVLSEFLISHGYSVAFARNGKETVHCVENDSSIQIVLLDVNMPEMGGIEALSIIMSRNPHPIVIMMTAVADREIARQAIKTGAFDYIVKPFDFAAVEASIGASLSYSEYQKQPWWKRLTSR